MKGLEYSDSLPELIVRPFKRRPRKLENWNNREIMLLRETISKYKNELQHIKETNRLPESWTMREAKVFRRMRLISQSGKGWKINRSIEKWFE